MRPRALDAFGNVATSFAGTVTISIAPGSTVGCSTSCTDPTTSGAFSSGVWTGSVTFGSPAGTGRTLTAISGSVTGASNAFDISDPTRAPPIARFTRTPAVVAMNQTVTFDALGSSDRQTATGGLQA